jgi:hypothetical protein
MAGGGIVEALARFAKMIMSPSTTPLSASGRSTSSRALAPRGTPGRGGA